MKAIIISIIITIAATFNANAETIDNLVYSNLKTYDLMLSYAKASKYSNITHIDDDEYFWRSDYGETFYFDDSDDDNKTINFWDKDKSFIICVTQSGYYSIWTPTQDSYYNANLDTYVVVVYKDPAYNFNYWYVKDPNSKECDDACEVAQNDNCLKYFFWQKDEDTVSLIDGYNKFNLDNPVDLSDFLECSSYQEVLQLKKEFKQVMTEED